MARRRRDADSKRNPSRSIKIHDRDELLRRGMDERNGKKGPEKKNRRTENRYTAERNTRAAQRMNSVSAGQTRASAA